MTQRVLITPDDVADAHEIVAAAALAMGGQFDDRIKKLRAIRDDMKARQGVVETLDAAQQVRAEADSYADRVRRDAEQALAAAKQEKADADADRQAAAAALKDAESLKAAEQSALEGIQSSRAEWEAEAASRRSDLEAQQRALDAKSDEIAGVWREANALKATLQERLQALANVA